MKDRCDTDVTPIIPFGLQAAPSPYLRFGSVGVGVGARVEDHRSPEGMGQEV